jgi:cellulose synthase/poly-beta-1,6-N-acetylglucosamine synthase-like glycosyltransferase
VVVHDNPENLGKAGGVTNILPAENLLTRYTHICFLDADTLVDAGYFQAVRGWLKEDHREAEKKKRRPIGVICGRAKSIPYNWLTAFRAFEYFLSHHLHKPAQSQLGAITVAPGCASTYSVEALKVVIWNHDTVVEDMDVTVQAALKGFRIVYVGDACVYTQDPHTFRDYIGQLSRRWYAGYWQVMGKHQLLWRGPFTMLNWECRLPVIEAGLYVFALVVALLFFHARLPKIIGWTFAYAIIPAAVAAWVERRKDILLYSLVFPFMQIFNLVLFVMAMPNIAGRRRTRKTWYSPARYAMDETKAK